MIVCDQSVSKVQYLKQQQQEESEEEKKGVSDEVRTQRWFSDPMFEALASKEEESDEEAIQAMKDAQRKSVKRALPLEERLRAYSGRCWGW